MTKVDSDTRVSDAAPGNWVDRWAPGPARPYLRLMRADRPIGVWLLLWPCLWSLALALPAAEGPGEVLKFVLLFSVGAFVMRGAGCTYNDIVDRDIDARVARTARRPVASGQIPVVAAWVFLGLQLLAGLLVLLSFNAFAILLGIASLGLVALYPFMKRWTYWPQAFLGLTFNWGALMGWAALNEGLGIAPVLLYAGCIFWTIGYDTIYAHQDKEDDLTIGVKSSALKLGYATPIWLVLFYGGMLSLFAAAGLFAGIGWAYYPALLAVAAHALWQIRTADVDRPGLCLKLFKSNRDLGALMLTAILIGWLV